MRPEPLAFEPWAAAPALRSLPEGPVSVGAPLALVGIGASAAAEAVTPPADLCGALFDDPGTSQVPVAFFTDHYCPNCRSMAATLAEQPDIEISRHELPVLGPGSVVAARAVLAAGLQGGESELRRRLRRAAFVPTDAYIADVADGLGLDAARLIEDLDASEVDSALRKDLRLASALGFAAVPVTVVGRTVVIGEVGARTLSRLVEVERRAGSPCPLGD